MGRTSGATATGPGSVLAVATYAPASQATYTIGSSLAALDTTNLTISFTAPASGRVLARAAMWGRVSPAIGALGDSAWLGVCYTDHTSGSQVSAVGRFLELTTVSTAEAQQVGGVCQYEALVTGLTAGTTYEWDLAAGYQASAAPQQVIMAASSGTFGNVTGPALLVIVQD